MVIPTEVASAFFQYESHQHCLCAANKIFCVLRGTSGFLYCFVIPLGQGSLNWGIFAYLKGYISG